MTAKVFASWLLVIMLVSIAAGFLFRGHTDYLKIGAIVAIAILTGTALKMGLK